MVLNRSKGALAGALALMMVGCAADAADVAHGESAYDPEDDAPVQALAVYDDVTSADQGSSRSSGSSSSGSKPSSSSSSSAGDVSSSGSASAGSSSSGRAGTTTPSTGLWDPTSVANLCLLARDPRAAILCRVTLTDCTKPAAPLDAFTQILCQLRGFLPGGSSNGGSAKAPTPDTTTAAPTATGTSGI